MYIITENMKNRIQSERSDSNTISQLLWIVGVVIVAMGIISVLTRTTSKKGKEVSDTIENSTFSFQKEFDEGQQ